MKIVRVAIIGVGYWGPNLVRNFLKIPGVEVAYICDLKKKNLEKIHTLYPQIPLTQSYEHVLADKTVDFVAIATPLTSHFPLAKQALEANKHVFIEKPMTQTSSQATELIKLAKKHKKMLMVGHTFVYSAAVKKIKSLVEKKTIGEFYYYDSTRINLGGGHADTNVIWDLATHDLAILSYIFPEKVSSVQVIASQHQHPKHCEIAHLFLRFNTSVMAHIHVSWLSPVKIRSILIGGSKKMIVYNDIEPTEKLKIYHNEVATLTQISPFSPAYRSGDITIPKLSQQETMHTQLLDAITAIRTHKQPISTSEQGLQVVKLLEALEESLRTKKKVLL